jgi:hypothetical protein
MSQNATPKKLTPRQVQGVIALMSSPSISAAADKIGVQRQTMLRWMKDDNFNAVLQEQKTEALAQASRALLHLAQGATIALAQGLKAEKISVRLRSADIVLTKLLQLHNAIEVEQRLDALEARLNDVNIEN